MSTPEQVEPSGRQLSPERAAAAAMVEQARQQAGVFDSLPQVLLVEPNAAEAVDCSRTPPPSAPKNGAPDKSMPGGARRNGPNAA
ncbi:hypothetical protein [Actinopolyspora mzabensis]|uniref:hypothetical protein n=1 Tax=Actinopolyspora mzabensis TaxID=995066 RepID=UPI00115FC6AB|nr:hypothetical protein [Actinopolyspora mzabensis]